MQDVSDLSFDELLLLCQTAADNGRAQMLNNRAAQRIIIELCCAGGTIIQVICMSRRCVPESRLEPMPRWHWIHNHIEKPSGSEGKSYVQVHGALGTLGAYSAWSEFR